LQLMEQGEAEAAVQYWRNSYFFHWGHHAAAAVWAIEFHYPKIKDGESGRREGFPSRLPHHRTCGSAYGGS
jgi:hypothetical protein